MDFWRTVAVLFRRWYITIPAFFATLFLASAGFSLAPVEYQSSSILVLTTPLSGGTETTNPAAPKSITNPMLNFDRSLALSASIVIQQMSSPETARTLGISRTGTTSYQVTNGSSNPELLESGPFLFIQGTAPTPEEAREVTTRVAAMAVSVLDQRQADLDAPAGTHIGIQTVVAPTEGQPLMGSPLRAAAAVGALSCLASLMAVFGFESLMTNRRRRRAERAAAGPPPLPAGGDEPSVPRPVAPGVFVTGPPRRVNGSAVAGSGAEQR